MRKTEFTIVVIAENNGGARVASVEHTFDPDDIYDAGLAAVVREVARDAAFKAGLRDSPELAGLADLPVPPLWGEDRIETAVSDVRREIGESLEREVVLCVECGCPADEDGYCTRVDCPRCGKVAT